VILDGVTAYVVLFVAQVAQAWFRSWNIKTLSSGDKWGARFSWLLYGIVWLTAIYIGIKSMMEGDWLGIFIWFAGSMLGQECAMYGKRSKKVRERDGDKISGN